jgi:hypothetical protein
MGRKKVDIDTKKQCQEDNDARNGQGMPTTRLHVLYFPCN